MTFGLVRVAGRVLAQLGLRHSCQTVGAATFAKSNDPGDRLAFQYKVFGPNRSRQRNGGGGCRANRGFFGPSNMDYPPFERRDASVLGAGVQLIRP